MATKGKLVHRQAFSSTFIAGMHALRMGAIPGRTACCDALGLDSTALQLIILICNCEGLRHAQKPKYYEYLVKYVQSHIQAGPALMQANCPTGAVHVVTTSVHCRTSPHCSYLPISQEGHIVPASLAG